MYDVLPNSLQMKHPDVHLAKACTFVNTKLSGGFILDETTCLAGASSYQVFLVDGSAAYRMSHAFQ
uniref:Uncharacterized protein n=1 Tax=Manihot esculenta TaxID=3983 RepID=A0A2C9UWY9_MANES